MAVESTWSDPEAELEGSASGEVADLPAAVALIRDLEDQILATLAGSEKTLRSLEARDVHSLAGYDAFEELEERLVALTTLLGPMRGAVLPARHRPPERPPGPRLVGDDRSRRVKALSSIARALARLRELDAQLRESTDAVVAALDEVDASRSYEQCGYVSYEDFLERAVAPSVALSSALLLARKALPPPPEAPPSEELSVEPPHVDELRPEPPDPAPHAAPLTPAATGDEPRHATPPRAPARGAWKETVKVLALAAVAAAAGVLAALHPWQ